MSNDNEFYRGYVASARDFEKYFVNLLQDFNHGRTYKDAVQILGFISEKIWEQKIEDAIEDEPEKGLVYPDKEVGIESVTNKEDILSFLSDVFGADNVVVHDFTKGGFKI